MKKYLKLLILLLIIPILNVNALSKGDKVKMTSIYKANSSSMYWNFKYTKNQAMNIYKYYVNTSYESYCINAHLNDVKEGEELMVEAVIGSSEESTELSKYYYGYYAIFNAKKNGNYSQAQFISALRLYTLITKVFSIGELNCDDANDKCQTRKQMYYHYVNLANDILPNLDKLRNKSIDISDANKVYQFTIKESKKGSVKNNITKLVQIGIDAATEYANTVEVGTKSEIYNPSVEVSSPTYDKDTNKLTYKMTLTGFPESDDKTNGVSNQIGIIFKGIDSINDYTIYVEGDKTKEDIKSELLEGTPYYYDKDAATLVIEVDASKLTDEVKQSLCDGKINVNYEITGIDSYTGAVFCKKGADGECDPTYQRYISINISDGNTAKSEKLSGIDSICKEEEEEDPTPTPTPKKDYCDATKLTAEEYACCIDIDSCKPKNGCDDTQYDCDPDDCDDDINVDKLKTTCSDTTNPETLTYEEGASGVYQCVLNKAYVDSEKYIVKETNSYCSTVCKEGYSFKLPSKLISRAGRSFNIDMTLQRAEVECYFTTATKQYRYDYTYYSMMTYNAIEEYNSIVTSCNALLYTEDGTDSDVYMCLTNNNSKLKELASNIETYQKELQLANNDYNECIDANNDIQNGENPLDWSVETTINSIKYSYGEPQNGKDSEKYSTLAGDDASYEQKNEASYGNDGNGNVETYYISDAKTLTQVETPSKSSKTYYKCSYTTDEDNINTYTCNYERESSIDPYGYWHKYTYNNIEYDTKRVYYTEASTGKITVSKTNPGETTYSLVRGLPIGYDTNEGTYEYKITLNKLGINGRVTEKLKELSKSKTTEDYTSYVCTYTVNESETPGTNKCVQNMNTGTQYICSNEVYYDIKAEIGSSGSISNWSEFMDPYIEKGDCHIATDDEKSCVQSKTIDNYNCDEGRYGRQCLITTTGKTGGETPTESKKTYDITYRTITNNNILPNSDTRTVGFNWDISSSNSLVARKAVDTMNYIAYRAQAVYEAAGGESKGSVSTKYDVDGINTTITVTLDSKAINYLKNLDTTADTLECYDYIYNKEGINEDQCDEKGYTWTTDEKGKGICKAENIFCYSTVIDELVNNDDYTIDSGTRPTEHKDLYASDFTSLGDFSTVDNLSDDLSSLSYVPVTEGTDNNAIDTEYYQITTSSELSDYWTVYDFVTLDVDGDGNADIGPSWK